MNDVRRKLHQIRDKLHETFRHEGQHVQVASTTIDFEGLVARAPWDKADIRTQEVSQNINNHAASEVPCNIRRLLEAMITGIMTCVQDSSGSVELSLYNWLPKAYVKSLDDLDWAIPKGSRIRIREPYLKCAKPSPMAMFTGGFVPNIFVRVDEPEDVQFHPNQPTPDFAERFKSHVNAILRPSKTRTASSGLVRCFSDFVPNVEVRSSATGEGLFTSKALTKDEIVFVEKAIVAADGQHGFAFQLGAKEYGDINTYAPYEELAFLNRCSGGELYSRVVSRLFPAKTNAESKSLLTNIYEVVQSNTFSVRTHDELIKASTRPPSPQEVPTKPSRSALWDLASKMNHDCAPNTYTSVVDDMMYVFARQDIPVGTELFTRYFDVDVDFPRKFGIRGQERFFVCRCVTCVEWQRRQNKLDIKAVQTAESMPEVQQICRSRRIDLENGLSKQDIYVLRKPIFEVAQSWMLQNPPRAIKLLYNLLFALRKFDSAMEMTIQTHLGGRPNLQ
ncbi:hypothetical protein BGX26_008519 [Mortierella sp. AD094]|nr:hypothetical protein BGX26_008519 [Mortierella sp. AD094]